MTRTRFATFTLIPAVLLLATGALASDDQDLRRLFPSVAPVSVDGPGLARLAVPPRVLAACRSDLSDLRLLTADGREIPYVVVAAPSGRAPETPVARVRPDVVAAERHQKRREDGPPVYLESYTVSVPPLPDGAAAWRLRLAVRRTELVCRIDVEARLRDGSRRTLLAGGSLFRLRRPAAQRLQFALPAVDAASLAIRLGGENGGYVEPVVVLEAMAGPPPPAPLEVPLTLVSRRRQGERTVAAFRRPRGLVPARLRVGTSTPSFLRPTTVWDVGPGADTAVGKGDIYRLDAIVPVERREIAVRPAHGDRLRLEIDNGDSPPLADLACSALIPAPVLLFSAPGDRSNLALYFGGRRTHRPRYDLAGFARGRAGAAAWDPAHARPAALGAVVRNPAFDPAPALAFLMRPGAELAARSYSHRRTLEVHPSVEGLSRLELSPADLALCRRDLSDLRIIDGDGRQWSYLLIGRDAFSPEEVSFDRGEGNAGESRYRIELPATPVEISGMSLDSEAPFFDRPYRVVRTPPGGREQVLGSGRLKRRRGRRLPIRLKARRAVVERLALVIEDGGDAPLRLTHIRVGLQHPVVFLPAPAGSYTLLLGNPSAQAPRYEISAARSVVLGVPAGSVDTGPLEPNPAYSASARLFGGGGVQQLLLWAVLILAAIVLALLTLRLARKEEEE